MKGYQYHYPKEENSEAFYLCMEDLAFNGLERSCLKQNIFYNAAPPPSTADLWEVLMHGSLQGPAVHIGYCATSSCLLKV